MSASHWTRVIDVDAIAIGAAATVRPDGKQVAVFRVDADSVWAVDNRCPHEGYPLANGAIRDGVLTCEWHNWKFRLCDGECIFGGEDVRSYPVVHGQRGAVRIIDALIITSLAFLAVGYFTGGLPWRIFIMFAAPAVQLVLYKRWLARGITSRDCVNLTWLGAALLASYHLWIVAELPGV